MQTKKIVIIILILLICFYLYFFYSPSPEPVVTPIPTISEDEIKKFADEISVKYTVNPNEVLMQERKKDISDLDERLAKKGIYTEPPVSMFNNSTKYPLTEAAIRYTYPLFKSDDKYRITKEAFEKILNDTLMSDNQTYKDILSAMKSAGIQLPNKATIPFFNCFILYSSTFNNNYIKISKKDIDEGKIGEYDIIGAFFFLNLESWLTKLDQKKLLDNQFYSVETKELSISAEIMNTIITKVIFNFDDNERFFFTTFIQPIYIDDFVPKVSRGFSNYRNNENINQYYISPSKRWNEMSEKCRIKPELNEFSII